MLARSFRVVDGAAARDQIALIGVQRFGDGCRAAVVSDLAGLPPRKLLRLILRLIKIQDALAVAGIEIVSFGEGFGPVLAVTITHLDDPRTVGLVAPV